MKQATIEQAMPHLELPIVLVHGIFMRDDSRLAWGRIPFWLSEGANAVFFAGTDACSPVELSAEVLAHSIDNACEACGAEAVHLIAFSRGGIDARYCAGQFGQFGQDGRNGRIASITTLCTPHAGSFVARNGLAVLPDVAARAVSRAAGWGACVLGDSQPEAYRVFRDLGVTTPETGNWDAAACNAATSAKATSPYCQSYALASERPCRLSFMQPVRGEDLPNDGLVSERSAAWANFRGSFFPVDSSALDTKHRDMVDMRRRELHLAIRRPDGSTHDVGNLRNAWCLMLHDLKEVM